MSSSSPVDISDGHHPDRFVEIGSLTKVVTSTVLQRPACCAMTTRSNAG
ncbi:hypothetical protein [Streptomyces sp. NPDC005141]